MSTSPSISTMDAPDTAQGEREGARPQRNRAFVAALRELVEKRERGTLAALRRGLGKAPEDAGEMFPFVWSHLPPSVPDRDVPSYFLVAALFAWHPRSWEAQGERGEPNNFGASVARLAQQRDSASIEARFVALLNAHPDDLKHHLQHAVGLLRAEEIPVDWVQLLDDLQHWESERRWVQRRWARAYWGYRPRTAEGSSETAGSVEPATDVAEKGRT